MGWSTLVWARMFCCPLSWSSSVQGQTETVQAPQCLCSHRHALPWLVPRAGGPTTVPTSTLVVELHTLATEHSLVAQGYFHSENVCQHTTLYPAGKSQGFLSSQQSFQRCAPIAVFYCLWLKIYSSLCWFCLGHTSDFTDLKQNFVWIHRNKYCNICPKLQCINCVPNAFE